MPYLSNSNQGNEEKQLCRECKKSFTKNPCWNLVKAEGKSIVPDKQMRLDVDGQMVSSQFKYRELFLRSLAKITLSVNLFGSSRNRKVLEALNVPSVPNYKTIMKVFMKLAEKKLARLKTMDLLSSAGSLVQYQEAELFFDFIINFYRTVETTATSHRIFDSTKYKIWRNIHRNPCCAEQLRPSREPMREYTDRQLFYNCGHSSKVHIHGYWRRTQWSKIRRRRYGFRSRRTI